MNYRLLIYMILFGVVSFGQILEPNNINKIPTRFSKNHIYIELEREDGATFNLMLNTASPSNIIFNEAVERLELPINVVGENDYSVRITPVPNLKSTLFFPLPLIKEIGCSNLQIIEKPSNSYAVTDGMLGKNWFAGRIICLDYQNSEVGLLDIVDYEDFSRENTHQLHFPKNEEGKIISYLPSLEIRIGQESHDFLLHTGESLNVTQEIAEITNLEVGENSKSIITESNFARLLQENPTWRIHDYLDESENKRLVEVPTVTIGSHSVGPIWFEVRRDGYTNSFIDLGYREIVGSIGGNLLKYFSIILDYPREQAIILH